MNINKVQPVFFEPDLDMVQWLKWYAADRIIFEIGCGSGHLLRFLQSVGAKCWGLEPQWDYMTESIESVREGRDILHVMPWPVEKSSRLFKDLTAENTLVVIARPCHSSFIETTLDMMPVGMECLYITIPQNMVIYNDLGKYRSLAEEIDPDGTSKENEVFYSIIKQPVEELEEV